MPELKVNNLVKFYAVLLLLEKKQHGYELMKEIGKRLDKKVSPGQMYSFLAELEARGFIHASSAGIRDKTPYSLTYSGKKFANSVLERTGSLIELAIKPKLNECLHCGCKVYEGGFRKKIHGKDAVFCCEHCARSFESGHHH